MSTARWLQPTAILLVAVIALSSCTNSVTHHPAQTTQQATVTA
jgi:hypothetical protein